MPYRRRSTPLAGRGRHPFDQERRALQDEGVDVEYPKEEAHHKRHDSRRVVHGARRRIKVPSASPSAPISPSVRPTS